MQVQKHELERQQQILKALGFYHGKIDGIWGPKSIDAKKKFEASPSFPPGIPNNGMPFRDNGPYPAGVTMNHMTGLLEHPRMNEVKEAPVQIEKAAEAESIDDEQE